MNNYTVYKHTTPSGKVYIGITSKDVKKRWLNGRGYARNEHFWNAIKKYGWDNIEHTILVTGLSKEEASEVEKFYIALFRSHEPKHGYNLTEGGETGIVHTMESRRKLSESRKGQHYNIGVPFTEERKRHLSENHADVSGEKIPTGERRNRSKKLLADKHIENTQRVQTIRARDRFSNSIWTGTS